jgi:hypothetical protein
MNTKAGFRKSRVSLALLGAMGLVATSMSAYAQHTAIAGVVFTTKFVCGPSGGVTFDSSINVHNPHLEEICVNKKMVIAKPQGEDRGEISAKVLERFGPNEAIGVDCADIRSAFAEPPDAFIEGFVVMELIPDPLLAIHAPGLAVQGVYTATGRRGTSLEVMNNFVGEAGGLDSEFPLDTPPTFPCPPLQ